MKTYYNNDYTASLYEFDTTRKAGAIGYSMMTDPIANAEIVNPDESFINSDGELQESNFFKVAEENLMEIHSEEYFNAVKTGTPRSLSESQGFDWDEETYKMSVSHTSGLIAATHDAVTNKRTAGSLSSGLHHAHIGYGSGFCTFNGLAASANYAVKTLGLKRVLILDLDAHSGGGTWEIINTFLPESVVQVDVSCQAFDTWKPEGESAIWYTGHQDYRKDIDRALTYVSKKLDPFDLIIYNAGMDPLNSGVSLKDIVYRENAVRELIGDTPAIFALAGGYTWGNKTIEDVVSWHRITIQTWADAEELQTTMV